jgi:hypothetical protein
LAARPSRIRILDGETINVETLKGMLGETGIAAKRDGQVQTGPSPAEAASALPTGQTLSVRID